MNDVVFPPPLRTGNARSIAACAALLCVLVGSAGCPSPDRTDLDYSYDVEQFVVLPEFDAIDGQPLVQFESVFWEPDDTTSLRELIVKDQIAAGRSVLEIGTGTGLLSLLSLSNGAQKVVATDINPAAVANARYNVAMHHDDARFEVRQVAPSDPGAFAVIKPDETFDLILSNPPWEDGKVAAPADHAFYDPDFALMDSLLDGLPQRLNPGGRCLLAYGHAPAITRLLSEAKARGYQTKVLDDRDVEQLPRDFLPGMLIEVRLGRNQIPKVNASSGDPPATDLR
ncbi:N5-glutamine S-adenosyl-L-methionine-dependent methyltransferase [Stieleria maiorica]|uniref:N5-glutamine S-adenosyl-L-methionine-dependent methyltransferase n=1 Tax=Stieleria maiorica TaxID=2795974 RepID=A0A5B9MH12_9BACT|nr:50S ribosomal protein L11 methyltransferase [Stieleria maiorica]QEG00573.1 N5-glutamine S-adenosyl-L-methionine-dependent methyltransferase [Stieleria maiorica]